MYVRRYLVLSAIAAAFLLSSCLLPGMIPLESTPEGPMPYMETNSDTVLQVLKEQEWRYLQALVEEQYTDEEVSRPGTLTFNAKITDETPVYFNYGWCAVDEATLQQNFEHITVKLYINDTELDEDVVHNLAYTSPDNLVCLDYGVLTSAWPDGEYELRSVVTFEESINDGLGDYAAGDYISIYNVTVLKQKEGAPAPSSVNQQSDI